MDLSKLLAISGKPGLFLVVGQTKNGIIVESLIDKKRIPVYASVKASSLKDISVFTEDQDVPLAVVIKSIKEKENGGPAIDPKSDDKSLRNYFEQVLPSFDKDRVYTSDIKKVLTWYNTLQANDLLDFTIEEETSENETIVAQENVETKVEESVEEKPKKTKKSATKAEKNEKSEENDEVVVEKKKTTKKVK